MRTVETAGKTIEEAKELAAEELGVPIEQISFEVIEEGGKGFLGIARSARVKATVYEDGESAPAAEAEEVEFPEAPAAEPRGTGDKTAGEWTLGMVRDVLEAANIDATPELTSESEEEINIEIT